MPICLQVSTSTQFNLSKHPNSHRIQELEKQSAHKQELLTCFWMEHTILQYTKTILCERKMHQDAPKQAS
eukprot:m.130661 g.130661  ORF g.130661 m.130661 type:complete len:70 (+) comp15881_c0_seq1:1560-1769(+)